MSETSKAVFLSHACQDSEAARRLAEALRASAIEGCARWPNGLDGTARPDQLEAAHG